MSWTEIRSIKLVLLRSIPHDDDWSIKFWVAESNRNPFEVVLMNYLMFAEGLGSIISVEDHEDSTSGERVTLVIRIRGNKQALGHELQRRAGEFQACSTRVE